MSIDRRRFLGAVAAGAGATLLGGASAGGVFAAAAPDSLAGLVRKNLARGLELGFPGMVCGVLAGGESYVAGAGRMAGAGSKTPDGRTLFQLGSITKTFTGLHLAIADRWGLARLADPLAAHAPRDWQIPQLGKRPIRLVDLATQASGLPAVPPNIGADPDFDPVNPYASYTRAALVRGLAATKLEHEPGTTYLYSNYAFGVLGEVLSRRTGGYENLLRALTLPLGMLDTTNRPPEFSLHRKATGHSLAGKPVPDWSGEVFEGAGSTAYGTANDLLRYLRAQLNPAATPFARALRTSQRPHFVVSEQHSMGLGWERFALPNGHTMILKNGGTGGFSSFAAFCPESKMGVAMINNISQPLDPNTPWPLDTLGIDLLRTLDKRS